jgi:hypothetical protein
MSLDVDTIPIDASAEATEVNLRPPAEADIARVAALGEALLAIPKIAHYLGAELRDYIDGDLAGRVAEFANEFGAKERGERIALEARMTELLTETLNEVKAVRRICQTLTDNRMETSTKVIQLEARLSRHMRGNEHCDSCEFRESQHAQ